MLHRLISIQTIPLDLNRAWDFFSDPGNLLVLTPPFLNLKVTNEVFGHTMYPGQIITYTVRPLWGIPLEWITEITHVKPKEMFVDEQRKGPYLLWHHQHHFRETVGGVEMTDIVHYRLPLGILGDTAHRLIVKNKLEQIFTYRFEKIRELWGAWPEQELRVKIQ